MFDSFSYIKTSSETGPGYYNCNHFYSCLYIKTSKIHLNHGQGIIKTKVRFVLYWQITILDQIRGGHAGFFCGQRIKMS